MLIGEYEHSLDAKGRLIMPAKLREDLGEKFIITKGLDGCLFGFSQNVHISCLNLPIYKRNEVFFIFGFRPPTSYKL